MKTSSYKVAYLSYLKSKARASGVLSNKKLLLSPGDFNDVCAQGIFNPGTIKYNDSIMMVSRCESKHWVHYDRSDPDWYHGHNDDVILSTWSLDDDGSMRWERYSVLAQNGLPENTRTEDHRLFYFKDKMYSNHVLIYKKNGHNTITPAISELNVDKNCIQFIGIPNVDFNYQGVQKNWMFFEHLGKLYMVYSISPWIVLELNDSLTSAKTIINTQLNIKWKVPGFVSCSTNPIEFDDKSYVIYYHTRFYDPKAFDPTLTYLHGALLINKETLIPSHYTASPFLVDGGDKGIFPKVIYISSAIDYESKQLLFYGEGDVYSGIYELNKNMLKNHMCSVSRLSRTKLRH